MFEFFVGLFAGMLAVGSFWFWLLVLLAAIGVTILVETENGGWATFTMVATIAIFNWAFKLHIFSAIAAHPWKTLEWVLVYFLTGTVWGLIKWFVFLHKQLAKYQEARDKFLKENNATDLTPALAAKFLDYLDRYLTRALIPIPPKASEHKGAIIRWMSYWPFSVVGSILNDVVRKAWNHVYNILVSTYDRVAAYVFRNYAGDIDLARSTKK
jgi:hypothetical protein